jgi:hypothetical protein
MRRTKWLQTGRVWAFSARFLRAVIGEWLFPMHVAKMAAHLCQTEWLQARAKDLTPREAKNLFRRNVAVQRGSLPSL